MDKDMLLENIAPCSCCCYTCLAKKDGAFSECAPRLGAFCEGVCEFIAESYGMSQEERERHYAFFDGFHNALKQLSGGSCHGCRNDLSLKRGCLKGCEIPDCANAHAVDFCADCPGFPCEKLKPSHINGSERIKAVGAQAFYEERKDVSHYAHYKKERQ